MSVQKFLNVMRMQASIASNNKSSTKIGKITGYDGNGNVTVEIYPADEETQSLQTGWLPLGATLSGDGYGVFCPPALGQLCEVHFQEDSLNNAYVGLRFNKGSAAPISVPSGEIWIVHQSGSYIKFTNNGNISVNSDQTIIVNAQNATVSADLVKVTSENILLGETEGGTLLPIMLSDNSPSLNVKAT